ncbi:MAG: TIGR00375 family protein, partial [Atribacterota bacterium]|nr:TIGR00375 family protein [Atribacterota bacterium]
MAEQMNQNKKQNQYFADLHVHIGRDSNDLPVKITASRKLTFENIARECLKRKGIDIVGIVDCASPRVIKDIEKLIGSGEMRELKDGGLIYRDTVTIILGSEIETREKNRGLSHLIAFFPYFADIREFSRKMKGVITNLNL